jgi:hypothetical protein
VILGPSRHDSPSIGRGTRSPETGTRLDVTDIEPVEGGGTRDPLRLLFGSLVAVTGTRPESDSTATSRIGGRDASGPEMRYVGLGALCAAEDAVGRLVRRVGGVARGAMRPVETAAVPLIPDSMRRRFEMAVRELDAYGRSVASSGSEGAVEVVETYAGEVAQDPAFLRIIDQVLVEVLPLVFARLNAQPEQVRSLVWGQSRGAAEDVANAARTRAASGDQAVEAFLGRILHRRTRPQGEDAPSSEAAPNGLLPAE